MRNHGLNRLLTGCCAVLASAVMLCAPAQAAYKPVEIERVSPSPAPALSLLDEGLKLLAASYGEGLTIVHFWATWCAPCVEELPHLEAFAKAHPEVKIYPISLDGKNAAAVRAFYTERTITALPLVLDAEQKTFRAFSASALPASIFVRNGHIIARAEGMVEWKSLRKDGLE